MQRQARWQQLVSSGAVSGYIRGGQVVVESSVAAEVPLTGTTVGTAYGTHLSGWTNVGAGATTFNLADPANTAAPRVTGTPRAGLVLTATNGSWNGKGPLTYTYQWQRCENGACTSIPGAASRTYTVTPADAGFTMRVVVTASGLTAWRSAVSTQTAAVAAVSLVNTGAPAISGNLQEGQTLHVSNGTWSGGGPITYTYKWHRCSGGTCAPIANAAAADYTLTADDAGATLKATVTAKNAAGQVAADSAETAVVGGLGPVNATAPSVAGTAQVGQTLTADPGTWTGTAPIEVEYQWVRCDGDGNCQAIDGAIAETYLVVPEDIGNFLGVIVTATNAAGSANTASPATTVVVEGP